MSERKNPPTLSVVITCYNYGKFVATAINSLLEQTTPIEIIVVDDCSSDNSREIISSFGDQVTAIFQAKNGGHGAGFNAGFAQSTGDLVMFLDADDFMLPGAAETILANYEEDIAVYHYRMRYADEAGALSGYHPPLEAPLADGDISERLRTEGKYNGTITSGLVFSRGVLEQVMPMDAEAYRQGGDGYLSSVAPLYGRSGSYDTAISGYRLHGAQHSNFQNAYAKRARWWMEHTKACRHSIREHSGKLGLRVTSDFEAHDFGDAHARFVSLLFEPEQHPYPNDKVKDLIALCARIQSQRLSGARLILSRLWWTALNLAPQSLRRTLVLWRIDGNARPGWLKAAGRFARRRGGITVG